MSAELDDLVARHMKAEEAVRAMENRSFPWFNEIALGFDDNAWTPVPYNAPWAFSSGLGSSPLGVKLMHDTVYLRGVFAQGTPAYPQLLGTLPARYRPEYDLHSFLRVGGFATAISAQGYTISAADGTIYLDDPPPDSKQLIIPNRSWPFHSVDVT